MTGNEQQHCVVVLCRSRSASIASVMLLASNFWLVSKKRPEPRSVLPPLLVTKLIWTPAPCCDASLPPVVIWISSKESKSK